MTPDLVLSFWFQALSPAQHWVKSPELDQDIARRFGALHARARTCELFTWRTSPEGRLAEVIVLDQFSRNIFRDRPDAFASDPLALALAQTAIAAGEDAPLAPTQRAFLYMPFMHSESRLIQAQSVELFGAEGLEGSLPSARRHKAVIDRFGRFPHRNDILGRPSTDEETAFLATSGSRF